MRNLGEELALDKRTVWPTIDRMETQDQAPHCPSHLKCPLLSGHENLPRVWTTSALRPDWKQHWLMSVAVASSMDRIAMPCLDCIVSQLTL